MILKSLVNGALGRFGYEVRSKQFVGSMDGFLQHLEGLNMPCTSILDVGANRATWSALARRRGPGASISRSGAPTVTVLPSYQGCSSGT